MPIAYTRALLRAALDGRLAGAPVRPEPNFVLLVPESCPEVPSDVLDPRGSWSDKRSYDDTARELTHRFEENFREFEPFVGDEVKDAAIRSCGPDPAPHPASSPSKRGRGHGCLKARVGGGGAC